MCDNQFSRVRDGKFVYYTCNEIKSLKDQWYDEFRKKNRSDRYEKAGMKDSAFERYKEEIEASLMMCKDTKEKIEDKCETCLPEDHEGDFCRCESRNIALAKQKREEGKSPWLSEKIN